MDKILQVIGYISLLIIAFIAGLMTNTSITLVDSEDLIAEINEIDSPELNDVPEANNTPDINEIPEIDNILEIKEPG